MSKFLGEFDETWIDDIDDCKSNIKKTKFKKYNSKSEFQHYYETRVRPHLVFTVRP